MSLPQLDTLLRHVYCYNSPVTPLREGRPVIKYIDPHIDNRTGTCFSITFRGFGSSTVFYTSNEQAENPKSLYDRCMTYVKTGEIT